MNSISIIGRILNLNLKKYSVASFNEKNDIMTFGIKAIEGFVCCPHCSKKTNKRQDLKEYVQTQTLKHINFSDDRIIEIRPIKRYFRCVSCHRHFLERFDFESEHGFHTKIFEQSVIASWGYMSGSQIAINSKTFPSKIYRILQSIDHTKINETGIEWLSSLDEIYLGVDEHSFSGHDMILIITELKTKKLVAILDGITKEKLESWINSLPFEVQIKIKGYSTDMNKGYKNVLNNICSHPVHSVDKFHLFEEANRMVDDTRILNSWLVKMNFVKADEIIASGKIPKKLTKENIKQMNQDSLSGEGEKAQSMRKYKASAEQRLKAEQVNPKDLKNSKGEVVPYQEITLDYFLETGYRKLFLTREKNLSGIQRLRLSQIFREFDYRGYLSETWTLKEDFMDAIDVLDMKEVDRIIADCKASEHHRMKQFGRTLVNWYAGIEGFCKHSTKDFKFTNALTEGMNNSCKVGMKQSHGFKNKDNYLRKIFVKCILRNARKNLFQSIS